MTKSVLMLTSLWLAAVSCGLGVLTVYEYTAGGATHTPSDWPSQSKIPLAPDRPTLVVFAHPKCPCTRATIGELAELMRHCKDSAKAYVVFLHPKRTGKSWLNTDLWKSAEAIPGVIVQADEEGKEAAFFKVTTSGQVVLYDAGGKLLFRGGITSSRGHYGDNVGLATILGLLNHEKGEVQETPVFGCSLLDPKSACFAGSAACSR